jgi:hypothetical protein
VINVLNLLGKLIRKYSNQSGLFNWYEILAERYFFIQCYYDKANNLVHFTQLGISVLASQSNVLHVTSICDKRG